MSDESEEKTEDASQRKLSKEREKGKTIRAIDAVAAIAVAIVLAYSALSIVRLSGQIGGLFDTVMDSLGDPDAAAMTRTMSLFSLFVWQVFVTFMGIAAAVATIVTVVVQGGMVFSTDPVMPKFERIDPVSTFMSLFKLRALSELGFALLRLALWTVIVVLALQYLTRDILAMIQLDLAGMIRFSLKFLGVVVVLAAIFLMLVAVTDLLLQKFLFADDMKMTKTDVKRERRDSQGDPMLTGLRKSTMRNMIENPVGLAHSTFVAVGPEGAVGIHYIHGQTPAPVLTLRVTGSAVRPLCTQARAQGIILVDGADLVRVLSRGIGIGEKLQDSAAVQPFTNAYLKSLGR